MSMASPVNPADINPVVEDCMRYFKTFRETHAPNLPAFLYSESLGGAIAFSRRGTHLERDSHSRVDSELSFKEEWKRKLGCASPKRVTMRPRAATAFELMRVCKELQGRFEEVDVPLLVVHGGDDVVCDPASAKEFMNALRVLIRH
ncbi:hypothetical protein NC651_019610 [Populus alba x Populus x berolinensis]|nr:hypothetical protein NC651_019610 [Populus alba x Populus x berolinensis]